ncbi:MAG TPA: hypothetical protein VFV90_11600 [Usitatibacter sp.]|nr:hypothetical protein [Usitatibacter sp.]
MSNERTVRDGFLNTVQEQIASGDPPVVRETRDRLVAHGLSENEAAQMIAIALRNEMKQMISESRSFDDVRFAGLLHQLPTLP